MTNQINFRGQKPVFKSEFLDNAIKKENYESYFLGNKNIDGNLCDLFLIRYDRGDYNAVIQYGKEEQEYASGATFMYHNVINKISSGYSEIYHRAIRQGLLKEETYHIGYSEEKSDIEFEEYINTEYYKNLPKQESLDVLWSLSDESRDKADKIYNEKLKNYNKEYEKSGKIIPKDPSSNSYFVFESKEDAIKYCEDGKGYFETHKCVSKEHISSVAHERNFSMKLYTLHFKNKKIKEMKSTEDILPKLKSKINSNSEKYNLLSVLKHLYINDSELMICRESSHHSLENGETFPEYIFISENELNQLLAGVKNTVPQIIDSISLKDDSVSVLNINKESAILSHNHHYKGEKFFGGIHFDIATLELIKEEMQTN